jgi:hypothetical protein
MHSRVGAIAAATLAEQVEALTSERDSLAARLVSPLIPAEEVQAMTALVTLAINLSVAGALCWSFRLGFDDRLAGILGTPRDDGWRPGCGKVAP